MIPETVVKLNIIDNSENIIISLSNMVSFKMVKLKQLNFSAKFNF